MPVLERDIFFERMAEQGLALTFDDVIEDTGKDSLEQCQVTMGDVNINGRFSTGIKLRAPFVSAAMDTVTEAPMAIAMAKLGGLGVIHYAMSIEEQRHQVRAVKLHQNGRIDKPITVQATATLKEVLAEFGDRFDFRTFPVEDADGLFAGMLTGHDFDLNQGELDKTVAEAMTPKEKVISASKGTDVPTAHDLMKRNRIKTIPVLDEGRIAELFLLSDTNKILTENSNPYNVDKDGRLIVAASITTDEKGMERLAELEKYIDAVVLDTAHGDSKFVFDAIKNVKEKYPDLQLVAGNISSGRSARLLALAGVDGIKVGQGGCSICTTRVETGIGCPQLTAVYECAKAIRDLGYDIPVCSDGGARFPGDVSKAIVAGAESVMMGNIVAGTDETPGEVVQINGKMMKPYRGMGSAEAMEDHAESRTRYEVGKEVDDPLAEGVSGYVPYKGPVAKVLSQFSQGLRKSMTYVGARNLKEHRENTRFWQVSNAGATESRPHDIEIFGR